MWQCSFLWKCKHRGKCGATVQQRDLYKVYSPVPPAQAVVLLYMQVP